MIFYAIFTCIALLSYVQAALYLFFYLPGTKTNRIFGLVLVSLAWTSLFYLLIQFAASTELVYLLDRLSAIGWMAFPWLMLLFVYYVTKTEHPAVKRLIFFVLTPFLLISFFGYVWQAETIRYFFRGESGIWQFDTNNRSLFYLFGITRISFCSVLIIWMLWRRYTAMQPAINRKIYIFTGVLFISFLLFISLNAISHFILPMTGNSSLPPIIHLSALPMIAAVFLLIILLRPGRFLPEMVAGLFIERIREFVFFVDHNGYIFSVNRFSLDMLNDNRSEVIGKKPDVFFKPENDSCSIFDDEAINRNVEPFLCYLTPKGAEPIPVLMSFKRINDQSHKPVGFVIMASDHRQAKRLENEYRARLEIEQRLLALNNELEDRIRFNTKVLLDAREKLEAEAALHEISRKLVFKELKAKEELLREIHHRVKNNIQMMVSLVNIEQNNLDQQSPMIKVYSSISNRVREISVIHDYLYDNPYMGRINFSNFVYKITGELRSRYLDRENVFFNIALADNQLSIEQAIPCGIIAYELINNSLKYAFPKGFILPGYKSNDLPTINVEFYCENDHFVLRINDNGKGLWLVNNRPQHKNTGLNLVETLANEYLRGEIRYRTDSGTAVFVQFPASLKNGKNEPG
jgi:two-component sensor histidine kinase/PAS domain-containing protein